jgi:hypothetical protein
MNKLLKTLFIIVIVAMLGAAFIQFFYPAYLGENTNYGLNNGWQREIGFWNLAIIPLLVACFIKYDYFFVRIIVLSLIVGGIGFGTNHLLAYIINTKKYMSLVGALENYMLVVLWLVGLHIEKRKQYNLNKL